MTQSVPIRELNQDTAGVMARVEAGETLTITRNGQPIATLSRQGIQPGPPTYPFRTDPMGPLDDLPTFDGPDLSDDEIDATLRGMGGDVD
ncbi:type II toxin-antitoxin system prevent-host-death family antitoxin [Streptomyces sp. B-S-A8]|uniref:Type II toxin-antitoxin system prevent-host-death family antitoxin n=1 Tax=Streptomyces solicavernae TaxID=3043614 RepID=A0ABT6S2B3_9ACTN|nr:type II toxin-antitoxin system prevent-host-death family antitoxin [Streptomyces sp. B-S-A8]MDI3390778.1 type II toxin-antitoxin system prevent-host-death family antitoxin [Streptomyces sp. B-S-A8]